MIDDDFLWAVTRGNIDSPRMTGYGRAHDAGKNPQARRLQTSFFWSSGFVGLLSSPSEDFTGSEPLLQHGWIWFLKSIKLPRLVHFLF